MNVTPYAGAQCSCHRQQGRLREDGSEEREARDRRDTDRYVSSNKAFEKLEKGDAIFLVTVRPPNEQLWLVGILESPKRQDDAWMSGPKT